MDQRIAFETWRLGFAVSEHAISQGLLLVNMHSHNLHTHFELHAARYLVQFSFNQAS
jgi:hypothetical protein